MDYKAEMSLILSELKKAIQNDRKQLRGLPKGRLVQVKQHGKMYLSKTEYRKGVRIRKFIGDDRSYAGLMIRALYLQEKINIMEQDYKTLKDSFSKIRGYELSSIVYELQKKYSMLDKGFIVDAVKDEMSDEWSNAPYEKFHDMDEGKCHMTSRGLLVRSKSEALIAEMLYENNVAFRYEQILTLGELRFVPDFTIKRADGKIFYWEHEGLMVNYEYRQRQYNKLRAYYENGIGPWDNLITTFDSEQGFINIREIDHIIHSKLVL